MAVQGMMGKTLNFPHFLSAANDFNLSTTGDELIVKEKLIPVKSKGTFT